MVQAPVRPEPWSASEEDVQKALDRSWRTGSEPVEQPQGPVNSGAAIGGKKVRPLVERLRRTGARQDGDPASVESRGRPPGYPPSLLRSRTGVLADVAAVSPQENSGNDRFRAGFHGGRAPLRLR